MLDHLPPRRDPRVLVLDACRGRVYHAAADPWEFRDVGRVAASPGAALAHDLARLALRARPSHVVAICPLRLPASFASMLTRRGVPVVALASARAGALLAGAPALADLRVRHPELRGVALGPHARAVRLAAAALFGLDLPPRRYDIPVPRQPVPPAAPVGARRARGDTSARGAPPAPGGGPRR